MFVNSVKVFPASIKSINPIQKYPHIIESYACILKIFVTTVDLSINFLISFGMFYTKIIKVPISFNAYKVIQWVPISEYSPRFITYAPSFILLWICVSGRFSLE